jgi:pseudouridylate synthase
LDVDTEGLLLLSSDGQFIHQVISPKREKEKEYEVWLDSVISDEDCSKLEK